MSWIEWQRRGSWRKLQLGRECLDEDEATDPAMGTAVLKWESRGRIRRLGRI